MWSITRELMKGSRRTLIPAGIAIAISALVICASFLLGNILTIAAVDAFTVDYGGADYKATWQNPNSYSVSYTATDNGKPAHTLGDTGLAAIGDVDGVGDVRIDLRESALLTAAAPGGATGNAATRSVQAVEASRDGTIMLYDLTDGAWPTQAGEIALDSHAADKLGVGIGDTVTMSLDMSWGATRTGDATIDAIINAQIPERITGLTDDANNTYAMLGGTVTVTPDDMLALQKAYLARSYGVSEDADDNEQNEQGGSTKPDLSYIPTLTHDGLDGEWTNVYFSIADGYDADAVLDAVKDTLDKKVTIISREDEANQYLEEDMGNGVIFTMEPLTFAILAMFVGALVVANTFRVLISQRRHTLALLRTIGATTGQIHGSVLLEGAIVGLAYSALGVALCYAVMGILAAANVTVYTTRVQIIPSVASIVVPLIFVTLVTVIASSGAARSATGISPVEALMPVDIVETRATKGASVVLSGAFLIAGILLIIVAMHHCTLLSTRFDGTDTVNAATVSDWMTIAIVGSVAGVICSFIGVIGLTVEWVPPFMAGFGWLAGLTGPAGKVAAGNIARNPRRVASTCTALLIAMTLIAAVATGASCATVSVDKMVTSQYLLDAAVSGDAVSEQMLTDLRTVDGVEDAAYITRLDADTPNIMDDDGSGPIQFSVFVVPDSAIGTIVPDVFGTNRLDDHTIYVDRQLYDYYNLTGAKKAKFTDHTVVRFTFNDASSVGGSVGSGCVDYSTGRAISCVSTGGSGKEPQIQKVTRSMKVQMVDFNLSSDRSFGAVTVISEGALRDLGLTITSHQIWMKIDTTRGSSGLAKIADELNDVANTSSQNAYLWGSFIAREEAMRTISTIMLVLFGLLAASVVISLVGVANTLSLSVIERRRESATLRAIGMTVGQLRGSLAWEAVILTIGASILGLALGAFYGWLLVRLVFINYEFVVQLNWGIYGLTLLITLAAALLASILPARRATSVPPVEALADE